MTRRTGSLLMLLSAICGSLLLFLFITSNSSYPTRRWSAQVELADLTAAASKNSAHDTLRAFQEFTMARPVGWRKPIMLSISYMTSSGWHNVGEPETDHHQVVYLSVSPQGNDFDNADAGLAGDVLQNYIRAFNSANPDSAAHIKLGYSGFSGSSSKIIWQQALGAIIFGSLLGVTPMLILICLRLLPVNQYKREL